MTNIVYPWNAKIFNLEKSRNLVWAPIVDWKRRKHDHLHRWRKQIGEFQWRFIIQWLESTVLKVDLEKIKADIVHMILITLGVFTLKLGIGQLPSLPSSHGVWLHYIFDVFEILHYKCGMFLKCNTIFMINLYEIKCYFFLKRNCLNHLAASCCLSYTLLVASRAWDLPWLSLQLGTSNLVHLVNTFSPKICYPWIRDK